MANECKEKFDVIIIGSGIAGLGAALSLIKMGKSVVIFEAKDYAGGRIRTVDVGGVKCDIGATWIEGIKNNPVAKMAEDFGVTTVIDAWNDGTENVAFDETTKKSFDFDMIEDYIDEFIDEDYLDKLRRKLPKSASAKDGLEKFSEEKKLDDFDKRIASYAIEEKHIGMDYGTSSRRMSLEYFEEEEEYSGDYVVFPSGFSQIIEGLASDVDIRLSTPVKNIDYNWDGVMVTTSQNETFYGKQVIVTASIGVLKSNIIGFDPPLPKQKTAALSRLDMAVSDKIILTFPSKFWACREMAFVASNPKESIHYWDFTYANGVPTLYGNFTGDSPLHHMTDEELVKLCQEQLSLAFSDIEVPQPTAFHVSRWLDDVYSQGSFSFIPVGASFNDMKTLAQSVKKKVFFAGEGTNPMYFGTTHGAFMSGLRAAREIKKIRS